MVQEDFLSVTELAGDEVSQEQVKRITDRYAWAASYCQDRDVVEVACGTGQGLGMLAAKARSVVGGDLNERAISIARQHYGSRIELQVFEAGKMPFPDRSKDVILLFEAIYYLPNVAQFLLECKRVLRPGGVLLIATANKDLFDFNPSPFSRTYYGAKELVELLEDHGFSPRLYGNTPVGTVSARQKVFRPIKKMARDLNLIPKTMAGKKMLRRLVFGKLTAMPREVQGDPITSESLPHLSGEVGDTAHKVLFCEARFGLDN